MCQGRKPSVLSTGPNFNTKSGSGKPFELSKLSNISTSKSVDFFCCWATNWQKSWAALTISAFPSSGDSTFTDDWQFKTGRKNKIFKNNTLFQIYFKISFKKKHSSHSKQESFTPFNFNIEADLAALLWKNLYITFVYLFTCSLIKVLRMTLYLWINPLENRDFSYSSIQSRPTLCITMNHSTPGLPVHHQLPEFTKLMSIKSSDAIQPSHPPLPPSPPPLNLSQHQGLFKWVSSSHQWPKYWSFSFNISPTNEHPGLISFRMDWLDLLAVQGTLKRTPMLTVHSLYTHFC